jgi:hypothetical protein
MAHIKKKKKKKKPFAPSIKLQSIFGEYDFHYTLGGGGDDS